MSRSKKIRTRSSFNSELPKSAGIGLHASFGYRIPFGERMHMLREAGFEATALWWEERRPEARKLRHLAPDLVRKAGLHLDNLHAPYFSCNDLWSTSRERRATSVALHAGWIGDCRRHGVGNLVMHVTLGKNPPPPSADGLESFRRLVETAEDLGVAIAIENTHAPGHIDYLLSRIDSPHLGLCFDAAHDRLYSPKPLALLRPWGPRLGVLHLSDVDGKRDRHWVPGDGTLNFSEVAGCLGGRARSASVLLECVGRQRDEDAETFLRRAHGAARRLQALFVTEGDSHVSKEKAAQG